MTPIDGTLTAIVGMRGYGKSVWCKNCTANDSRLLVYDPKASYNAQFLYGDSLIDWFENPPATFRIGTSDPNDCELVGSYSYLLKNNTLIIEEIVTLLRRGELVPDWLREQVFVGRDRTINIYILAQRAASIPIDIRSQCSRLISFMQNEPEDVKAIRSKIGDDALRLAQFPKLHCLDWSEDGIKEYDITF